MSKLLVSLVFVIALNKSDNFIWSVTPVVPEVTILKHAAKNATSPINPNFKTPPVLSPHVEPNLNQRTSREFSIKNLRNFFAFGLGSILALLAIWRQRKK